MPLPSSLTNVGFSPGRTTTITFDVPDHLLAQPPWWVTVKDEKITGHSKKTLTDGVHFVKDIGWMLFTEHDWIQDVHEENITDSKRLPMPTAKKFVASPTRSAVSVTGILDAGTPGDNFDQQQFKAGDDVTTSTYRQDTDQTSYPPPTEVEFIPLDRKNVGSDPMAPGEPLYFRFYVPGTGGGDSKGPLCRVYFTGLASSGKSEAAGVGNYALSLWGDGRARLYEKTDSSNSGAWVQRREFLWHDQHGVTGRWHLISVTSDAYLGDDGHWYGNFINIGYQSAREMIQTVANPLGGLASSATLVQYVVPQTITPNAVQPVPWRMDVRQDLRMYISVSRTKYRTPGTLQTIVFSNPYPMGSVGGTDPEIWVLADGVFPSGTSVDIALYGVDGTACGAGTQSGTFLKQTWKSFTRINNQSEYYAVFTLHSSGGAADQSPVIKTVSVERQGVLATQSITPWTLPAQACTDYSIVGPSMDPTLETASMGLISLQDGMTVGVDGLDDPMKPLTTRSGLSCRIELNIPAVTVNGNSVTTSTLFLGKMSSLRRTRVGVTRLSPTMRNGVSAKAAFPSPTWWIGKATLNGLWKRLVQAKTTYTKNFGTPDPDVPGSTIYRVTKAVHVALANAGLPETMLNIPDLPILLMDDPSGKSQAFQLEVYSEALQFAIGLLRDYLGAALVVDANATNGGGPTNKDGCVRVKLAPRPDPGTGAYPPLAKFVTKETWTDQPHQKLDLNSYAAFARADGHTIPVCPILGGTMRQWDEPPEGNAVYVAGCPILANWNGLQIPNVAGKLWAIIHNWPAATFFTAQPIACDPTHPDFTDGSPNPIILIDPTLNTQGAVNFAARRMFDLACHRREYISFEAPLVEVIDPLDTLQVRPRPLAWGDCVLLNDVYWFVSNCSIDTNGVQGGTRNGSAVYELFRIPQLMEIEGGVSTVYQQFQLYGPIASEKA